MGHISIAVAHIMVAVFSIEGSNTGVLCMLVLFFIVYNNTTGVVAWVYATETTIDSAMGVSLGNWNRNGRWRK